ncbi:MAG: hypothetical protein HJJLKODD_00330 [Phycisphaerae bacterium]|nr:hypothetical protein [Phycisphaerae bacterium]
MANDVVSNLGKWFWYLIPANPILIRVVHGGSRRLRHLWYRFGYLTVLFLVFVFSYLSNSNQLHGTLTDVAKTSASLFVGVSITQLLLMCFLAPTFTAGAITQEKDAETFNILLTTPLSNAQIIFGSLLSRLFFVIMLLFSGLPIFFITMIYGGVTLGQVIMSFAISGATAVVTGSLAIMIAMVKVGTRRTIFSFYLLIGLYLLLVWILGNGWSFTHVIEAKVNAAGDRMSWLAAFHPFLALKVGLNQTVAPGLAEVAHYGAPWKYLAAYPHVSYVVIMLLSSLGMVVLAMLFVRRGASEGETTFWTTLMARLTRRELVGERRRKPHRVWANPVAWREANTRASAAAASWMRWGMMGGGLLISIVLLFYLINGTPINWDGNLVPFGPDQARRILTYLVMVEFVLIVLVAINASATSMTKERESNSMDILLTTPLTSKYIIWGKLRGLISFTMPLVAVPIMSVFIFTIYDLITMVRKQPPVANFESAVTLTAMIIIYTALACVIGLQTSLKSKKTVRAMLLSITIMVMVTGLLSLIGNEIVGNAGIVGAVLAPLTPFTGIMMIMDPTTYAQPMGDPGVRFSILVGTVFALLAYGAIIWGMYNSLVKNFDMILRKQSAT